METILSYDPQTLNIFNSKFNYLLKAQKQKNNKFMVGQSYGSSRDYILADNLYYDTKYTEQGNLTKIIKDDKELADYIWVVFKKLFLDGILKEIANLKICTDDFLNKLKKEDLIQEKGTEIIDGLKLYTELTEQNTKVGVTKIIKKGLFVFSVLFFAHSVNIISEYFTEEKKNEDFKPLTLIFDVEGKGSKINEYYDLLDKIIENKDEVEKDANTKTHSFELNKIIEKLQEDGVSAGAGAGAGAGAAGAGDIIIKGHTFSRDILERSIRFCYAKFFNTTTFITILNTKKKNDKEVIIPFLFLLHLISDPLTKLKHILPNLTHTTLEGDFLELIDASQSVYNLMISRYCVSKLEKYLEGFQLSIIDGESVLGEKILSERNIEKIFDELKKTKSEVVGFIEEETGEELPQAAVDEAEVVRQAAKQEAAKQEAAEAAAGREGEVASPREESESSVAAAVEELESEPAPASTEEFISDISRQAGLDKPVEQIVQEEALKKEAAAEAEAEAAETAKLKAAADTAIKEQKYMKQIEGCENYGVDMTSQERQVCREKAAARKAAELELTEIIEDAERTNSNLNLIRVKRAEPLIRLKNTLPEGEQPTFLFSNPGDTRNTRPRLQFSDTNNVIENKIRNAWSSKFNSEKFDEIFQIKNINGNDKEITLKSSNLSESEVLKIIEKNLLTPDELQDVIYLIDSNGLKYVEEKEKCKEQGNYCLDNQSGVLNIISIDVNTTIKHLLLKEIEKILPSNHRINLQDPSKT